MVGGQKIQVGLAHARKMAEVTVEADTCRVTVDPGITITAPRTTSRDIRRHKASSYGPAAAPALPTRPWINQQMPWSWARTRVNAAYVGVPA